MDDRRITLSLDKPNEPRRILFATAEYAPMVKVGGLSEASSGLVGCLRSMGLDVEVVMPDYGLIELDDLTETTQVHSDEWIRPMTVRRGWSADAGPLTLISFPDSERTHPYVDPATGEGWPDNGDYFLQFSAAVAQLAADGGHEILHCNDWHSAPAIGRLPTDVASVLTVHNLAHQGKGPGHFSALLGVHGPAYVQNDEFNALAGGLSLADTVVMVSESYAAESVSVAGGFGLHERLDARGADLVGIRNGIDLGLWHPNEDPLLPSTFDHLDLSGKDVCRKELLHLAELSDTKGPVIGLVARFVHQKGVDLALELVPFLDKMGARLVLIGSGSAEIRQHAQRTAARFPDLVFAFDEYDERLAHLVVAGSDLLLVPSRFEPCGLTQMQAMTCGTIPVVTDVGGLRDTVTDTDLRPRAGTGYVAAEPTAMAMLDAVHRAVRGWSNPRRRASIQKRGMTADWSWAEPARRYESIYNSIV